MSFHSPHSIQDHTVLVPLLSCRPPLPPRRRANAIQGLALLLLRFAPLQPLFIYMSLRLEAIPLLCPVHRVPNVRARQRKSKQHKLDEEPCPAALVLLIARHAARRLLTALATRIGRVVGTGVLLVQVMRSNGDDVVIIVELASLSTEAEVSDGRDLEVGDLEALGPFVFGLVLELEAEEFVLVVGEAGDGGDLGVADAAGLACTISYVLISWWRRERWSVNHGDIRSIQRPH